MNGPLRILRSSDVADAVREWMPRQRWYADKGRTPLHVRAQEVFPFTDDEDRFGAVVLWCAAFTAGPPSVYQVLHGLRRAGGPAGPGADTEIGRFSGWSVTEALADAPAVRTLVDRILTGGDAGALRFCRETEDPPDLAPAAPVRPLGVEQSNSSVVVGDSHLLKVFRRPTAGVSLDLEVQRLLAAARSADTPRLLGSLEVTTGEGPVTLAVLQRYLPGAVDGWTAAARASGFEADARELGRVVARIHTDLAAHGPTAPLDTAAAQRIGRSLHSRLAAAVETDSALRPFVPAVRDLYARVERAAAGLGTTVQRIHGDLHLGQVVHADRRWLAVDFEGEPAATQPEREALHPVAKDIAGMLRSFEYRALADLAEDGVDDPVRRRNATQWATRCKDAFCEGYALRSGNDPRAQRLILLAYEIDKAIYEYAYEVRNRPHWAWIPRRALERLMTDAGSVDTHA